MSSVPSRELRNDTAGVLRRVEAGERVTITVNGDIELIDIDEQAARAWAQMRVHLAGSGRRITVDDLWIAASPHPAASRW